MATYNITIKPVNGGDNHSITCDDDQYILDAARAQMPYNLDKSLPGCISKLESGSVNQSGQSYLTNAQVAAGYVVTKDAYPTSDCVVITDVWWKEMIDSGNRERLPDDVY